MPPPKQNVFAYHQRRIARRTLELSDVGAKILGGMTKEEARLILKKPQERQKKGQFRERAYCKAPSNKVP